ncbi:ran-binding protein 3 isoform X1 [Megachile rotundata]|uniref:ran-binding protein 3 isoform X1 n=1 Tax=Megachile rotundata TaxID=143995 RepID=UPI000258DD86|nr:PREDICTED: ran-binding protein 3 isoform X1 [Megachile rotundata]
MADCKENKEETNRPSYVLKVFPPQDSPGDSPGDSPENSASEEMENAAAESNVQESSSSSNKVQGAARMKSCSKSFNPFGSSEFSNSSPNMTKSSILRPSQLGAVTQNNQTANKIVLQPAKFQNPFVKVTDSFLEEKNETANQSTKETKETKETKTEEKPTEEAKPTFLPLGASTKDSENNTVNSTVSSCDSEPSFVFGQNLKERVVVADDAESSEKSESEEPKEESTNENGSTELLFSNASAVCRTTTRPGLTLTEAAQELEEASRANKRKYSQVTLLTGEEGETNVLQINCKLFAFDKASGGWQERGRGTLRLNDRDEESRLVGRTAGTQRLILNTKVWPGMTAERAAPKSLRLTAMDVHGDIRIFIVQAAPKQIEQLHILLQQRLKRAQKHQPKKLATDH